MKVFRKHLQFYKSFILLLLCVLVTTPYPCETQMVYKGYKTLWEPFTRWHSTPRMRSQYTSAFRMKIIRVAIDRNKIPFHMKDDYELKDQAPPAGIRRKTLLNVNETTERPIYRDVFNPISQWDRGSGRFSTTRKKTWNRPTGWETPKPNRTIIWAWTTTAESIDDGKKPYWYHNDGWGHDDSFYGYLHRNRAKVGGKTIHQKPLPTATQIFGTTNMWRFWSYDPNSGGIDTFLALETEEQPSMRRARGQRTPETNNYTYCYVCGLDEEGIRGMPSCYEIFEGHNERRVQNKFKRRCVDARGSFRGAPESNKNWYGKLYRGGCFKRFTDIGTEYNERGCRTMEPVRGKSFASKRFAKLEKVLFDKDEGCVSSPLASLTPFSRPIYLYVRYHVCVCTGRYCNRTACAYADLTVTVLSCIFVLRITSLQ